MFRWYRRFKNRKRGLFRFEDGRQLRAADPLEIAQRMAVHPRYKPMHLSGAERGHRVDQKIVARAAVDIFDVEQWDDRKQIGMTQAELISLMISFDNYLLALKKNTRRSPTSPASTAATPQPSTPPTMSDSSHSGPLDSDPPSDKQREPGLASSPA